MSCGSSYPGSAGSSGAVMAWSPQYGPAQPSGRFFDQQFGRYPQWRRSDTLLAMYSVPVSSRRLGPGLIALLAVLAIGAGTGAYLAVRQWLAEPAGSPVAEGPGPNQPGTTTASAGTASTSFPAPTADACP